MPDILAGLGGVTQAFANYMTVRRQGDERATQRARQESMDAMAAFKALGQAQESKERLGLLRTQSETAARLAPSTIKLQEARARGAETTADIGQQNLDKARKDAELSEAIDAALVSKLGEDAVALMGATEKLAKYGALKETIEGQEVREELGTVEEVERERTAQAKSGTVIAGMAPSKEKLEIENRTADLAQKRQELILTKANPKTIKAIEEAMFFNAKMGMAHELVGQPGFDNIDQAFLYVATLPSPDAAMKQVTAITQALTLTDGNLLMQAFGSLVGDTVALQPENVEEARTMLLAIREVLLKGLKLQSVDIKEGIREVKERTGGPDDRFPRTGVPELKGVREPGAAKPTAVPEKKPAPPTTSTATETTTPAETPPRPKPTMGIEQFLASQELSAIQKNSIRELPKQHGQLISIERAEETGQSTLYFEDGLMFHVVPRPPPTTQGALDMDAWLEATKQESGQ